MKTACFSVATRDYFHAAGRFVPGGNSLNQAIAFASRGHESWFVGAVGTDEAGDQVRAFLAERRVDVSRLRRVEGSTARNEIKNDENGERYGVEGAWNGGVYPDFHLSDDDWNAIRGCDVWSTHIDGPNWGRALGEQKGQFLTVDFLHLQDYRLLSSERGRVDIAYFGGVQAQEGELLELSRAIDALVVLTLGRGGSMAFRQGTVFRQPALEVEHVVDTTGCGDAFQAAFTSCYFETRDIPRSLQEGAVAGRDATQHYGGAR